MHLTSSGLQVSITLALSIVSMLVYRWQHCGGVNGFWWIFIENVVSGSMSNRCTASSMVLTLLTERAKMSVKELIKLRTFCLLP